MWCLNQNGTSIALFYNYVFKTGGKVGSCWVSKYTPGPLPPDCCVESRPLLSPVEVRGVQPVVPLLTSREQQIVQLITEGMTNKDIARHLDIAVATTKSHVHSLLRKLSLNRRGRVALWARDHEGIGGDIMRHNRAEITKRSSDS